MSLVTRKAEYKYTLHDISEFEVDVIVGALDHYAEKFSSCEGAVTACQTLSEMLFKLRNAP